MSALIRGSEGQDKANGKPEEQVVRDGSAELFGGVHTTKGQKVKIAHCGSGWEGCTGEVRIKITDKACSV